MKTQQNLANNLRRLRELHNLSQRQAADLSGVPRPTWATLESGAANPTLTVLSKAAAALKVSIEELISPPRDSVRLIRAGQANQRNRRGGSLRPLLPEPIPGLSISRLALLPGGQITGAPHTQGTREYLTCEQGQVHLIAAGERYELLPGDTLIFRGDQRHSYLNPDKHQGTVAISVVCFGAGGM
ncbi:MAG: helix-turn-helix domain-containing protein [Pseudomonadales bacterium]